MPNPLSSQPLILTGMHRSGTSLAASLLQSAGISIGDQLVPPGVGNIKGHFEDHDFVDLHIAILKHHHLDWVGWTTQNPITIPPHLIEQAQQLLTQKSANHPDSHWGWKDPRTTLFLDFWHFLLPNARFLFLYRSPWEVFDSLARRGTDTELLQSPSQILHLWAFYNRQILRFIQLHPDQSLLLSNDSLAANPASLLLALNQKFNLNLPTSDPQLFDPSLLHRHSPLSWQAAAIHDFDPSLLDLLQQLHHHAHFPTPSPTPDNSPQSRRAAAASLLDQWLQLRAADLRLAHLQHSLDQNKDHSRYLEQTVNTQRLHAKNLQESITTQLHRISDLQQSITLHQQRIANLEQSLTNHKQHIANLEHALANHKKHAENLAQLLTTQQTHSANLEQLLTTQNTHIANLEIMLTTLKTHAANLEKLTHYQPAPSPTTPA